MESQTQANMDSPTQARGFLTQNYSALQQILLELALPKTRDRTPNPIKGKNIFEKGLSSLELAQVSVNHRELEGLGGIRAQGPLVS